MEILRFPRHVGFDAALGNVVSIIVSYDMGWSKRGNGRSYDSLNGYGAIIGFLSGKVLDFATRNRKCKKCDLGHDKNDHDCRRNFHGSAKAMEPDVGVQLINDSKILRGIGLEARVIIGDDDSSTIASIRRNSSKTIFKLSDQNHLRKHFIGDLYQLKPLYKEMSRKDSIPHLNKCFGYAISQNKGDAATLASTLRSIPEHVFGRHENCGTWCTRSSENGAASQKVLFKDPNLYEKLSTIFLKYANNAEKFCIAASSQSNESLNNIMAHKCHKNVSASLTESADYRFASAVLTKNDGESHVMTIKQQLMLSRGEHTESYAAKLDKKRMCRATNAKLRLAKTRRNILRQDREALRKRSEKSEGVQYESNCGMQINVNNNDYSHPKNITPEICEVVYFDLETSGFAYTADILQIAAKCGDFTFSAYASPTKKIESKASEITGLRDVAGELYLHGQKVDSTPLEYVLQSFLKYLQQLKKLCLLVAHNAAFDTPRLLLAVRNNSMVDDFGAIVVGFSDTLPLLKKIYPDRKGPGSFKLQTLAQELLHIAPEEHFHEALFDVEILEKITVSVISIDDLFSQRKDFAERLNHYASQQNASITVRCLDPLKDVVSRGMLKKIANAGITYDKLKEVQKECGKEGVIKLLSEPLSNNKPRVSKNKKILAAMIAFLAKAID